ncbi:VOC family protein [Cryptosporangium arvum]|jgi:catechol 2,3-dioxygenase-like lactoylglutathione lyase family enzyme|uniref:Putative dioxygenase of extradiol dioxygenase family n=1 Tax=Cryptosporangium arvum DSM 44712 TaxID=927661 RepID=A0A010ZR73_9ACTN|nr:VOC family protein [Cryptosporangium arvum]EXG81164.1 putative dioxygenase of extradiol dioxygenase family [Cryptosporangium arvum DSM 44712]
MSTSIQFNHTIVGARDREESARFLAGVLGVELGTAWGPFLPLALGNGVTLDFATMPPHLEVAPQHYAFLVPEESFDGIFGRITAAGIDYWADPARTKPGEINHDHGGRGVYFLDPSGHYLEVITQPYDNVV